MFKRNSQGLLPKHCTPCPCHSFFRSALNGPAVGCLLGLIPASEVETWNRGDWHPMAINHFLFPGYMIVFCRHHHHHNNNLIIFNWSEFQSISSSFQLSTYFNQAKTPGTPADAATPSTPAPLQLQHLPLVEGSTHRPYVVIPSWMRKSTNARMQLLRIVGLKHVFKTKGSTQI